MRNFANYTLFLIVGIFGACDNSPTEKLLVLNTQVIVADTIKDKIEEYYSENKGNDKPSISKGTPGKGSVENAKLMPFSGKNFLYFDTSSYLAGRAFVHHKVKNTILATYAELEKKVQGRKFFLMECSEQEGGKIMFHNTHQNGLSVDFMSPLLRNGKPCYDLDYTGKTHYLLEFDNSGKYEADKTIVMDFDLIALHILLLDEQAAKNGLKLSKVIIKTALKDELFATPNGQKLKEKGIYIVKSLDARTNSFHDDHYHIDFEIVK